MGSGKAKGSGIVLTLLRSGLDSVLSVPTMNEDQATRKRKDVAEIEEAIRIMEQHHLRRMARHPQYISKQDHTND
jgi:hypothetical protein